MSFDLEKDADKLTRMGPAQPEGETTVKIARRPGDEWNYDYTRLPWHKVCSTIKDKISIPLVSLVSNDTIEDMLCILMESQPEARDYEIVGVRGRTVEVRSSNWGVSAWEKLAPQLLGTGNPCEDFHVVQGAVLYARLKTTEQLEVEERTSSFDTNAVGNQWPHTPTNQEIGQLGHGFHHDPARGTLPYFTRGLEASTGAYAGSKATPQRKRRRPKENALIVLQAMEQKFQTQAPTMDELFDEVGDKLECPREGRRKEYFRLAVAKLADTETNKWLWRQDGNRVTLTEILPGDTDGAF